MERIKILIVEDDFIIATDIATRLTEQGYEIVDTVDDMPEAIEILENQEIDIALLDIFLGGKQLGLDIAEIINAQYNIPFIFLTSNSSHNIFELAKRLAPAAYLLKPFNDKQVSITIDVALHNFYAGKESEPDLAANQYDQDVLPHPNSLFLRKGQHYEKVEFHNILWLEAESNYTHITTNAGKYTYSTVLKEFEKKLPQNIFMRVHRSYIININSITGIEGKTLLINDKRIPVTKSIQNDVFKLFKIV